MSGAIALQPVPAVAFPASVIAQSIAQPNLPPGNQISLNGRFLTAPWQQWQASDGNHVGISDAVLINSMGVQLLNTNSATMQPIHWFTPSNQTLSLPTHLTTGLRYLDITDLAQRSRWQVTAKGTQLQVNTTPTHIVGIRQSQQPWGDRLVIELSQPTTWQTTQLAQGLLSLDAQIDGAIARQFQSRPGQFLAAVDLESSGNQTRFQLSLASDAAVRVWSLSSPNRVVVDVRPDAMNEQNVLWAPGLRWRQQVLGTGNARVPVIWLEVNPKQAGISLQPILPNPTTMMGIAPLAETARQAQTAAAINGGFFNRDRQLPLGAIRLNGQWLSGPILNRGAIAWDSNGSLEFGRLTLQETVTTQTGQRLPLTHLNSGYVQAGIARYTPAWGATYTSLTNGEIIVFVQNNQVVSQQVIEQVGTLSVQIPTNGYILVIRSNRSAATAFTLGTTLQLESTSNSPNLLRYPQILAAGPLLIQNRQIVLDASAESFSRAFAVEKASRSAIAQREDGILLLVAVHKRLDGTTLTLLDMAQLLQQLGAINALNLDGGSSTTLYLGGQILDRSTPTSRVHNGIGVFVKGNP